MTVSAKLRSVFLLFVCSLLPVLAAAQQFSGLTGTVSDVSGAPIQGVEVRLVDSLNGSDYAAVTDEQGSYIFVKVRPGSAYTLTFKRDGFRSYTLTEVALGVETTVTRNLQMEVGQITQVIEVKADGATTLDTSDATIGLVFDTTKLQQLPIQVRNSPAVLLSLQAGTTPFGNITGARDDQNNITIDGIDANDQATGQAFSTTGDASVDAIQEFRTTTSGDLADGGRASGGQINLVTKGGTNDFHGALREYHRNNKFGANSFFNNEAGVPLASLIRNQFGGNIGGPIKKDKLFFFFDYEGQRDASQDNVLRIVPLDHVRNGQLGYINSNPGCTSSSRITTQPGCITILSSEDLTTLDPAGVGPDTALLQYVNSRYPQANDLTAGDGVNTGGVRFNTPFHASNNTYIARVDFNISNNQKLFGRFNIVRDLQTDDDNINPGTGVQFPGDPATNLIETRDYSFAIGHTWTISSTKINQLTIGESQSNLGFPNVFHPQSPNEYIFGPYDSPYARIDVQSRIVPTFTYRDDFTYIHGKHTLTFGGVFRPITTTGFNLLDFNTVSYGLGGALLSLDDSVRPADILQTVTAVDQYDNAFPFTLGRTASVATAVSYDKDGNPFPAGSGAHRHDVFNEYEIYAQDSWRVRNNLTLTYGLRWSYQTVPYERDGFEATSNIKIDPYFATRVQAGLDGVSSNTSAPLVTYNLAGKGNNAPGFYSPTWRNFSPRVGFAYNPNFKDGLLGSVLGERKTTVRGSAAIIYDRTTTNAIAFTQDIFSFLFRNNVNSQFSDLATDPRFTAIDQLPATNIPVAIPRPFTPYVDEDGVPFGTQQAQIAYSVDPTFKTPYNYQFNFGVQRELPAGFFLEVDYAGRFAHKLLALGDSSQLTDFKDNTSGQFLIDAFNKMSTEVRTGAPITDQPFFENQMSLALQQGLGNPARTCLNTFGQSCTTFITDNLGSLVSIGDITDTLQALYGFNPGFSLPLFTPNVGIASQFGTNGMVTNKAASSYNALLVTVRKRLSNNLQFDFNYTYSHSIDNESASTNHAFTNLVCDISNLRVCRGNSDFDLKHVFNANFVYDLPVGQGQTFGRNIPRWANYVVGGWQVSGIVSWTSGLPFSTNTGAFPVGFIYDSPGLLTGERSGLTVHTHTDDAGALIYFADPAAAQGAFRNPFAGETGNRNDLRGPGFANVDLAVSKFWAMPWSEKHKLQLRMEAYNAFNHANFGLPNANINGGTFGQITSTVSPPRQIQFALRYDF